MEATASGTDGIHLKARTAGTPFSTTDLSITANSAGEVLLDTGASIPQVEVLQLAPDQTGQYAVGDSITITVDGKTASVTTDANQFVDAMRDSLVNEVNSLSNGITATSSGEGELTLTADVAGKGFTVSTSVTGGDTFMTTASESAGAPVIFIPTVSTLLWNTSPS